MHNYIEFIVGGEGEPPTESRGHEKKIPGPATFPFRCYFFPASLKAS